MDTNDDNLLRSVCTHAAPLPKSWARRPGTRGAHRSAGAARGPRARQGASVHSRPGAGDSKAAPDPAAARPAVKTAVTEAPSSHLQLLLPASEHLPGPTKPANPATRQAAASSNRRRRLMGRPAGRSDRAENPPPTWSVERSPAVARARLFEEGASGGGKLPGAPIGEVVSQSQRPSERAGLELPRDGGAFALPERATTPLDPVLTTHVCCLHYQSSLHLDLLATQSLCISWKETIVLPCL
nr:translation initiation factor IF-2-like [Peromyscus maniculatus bairdii]